MHTVSSPPTEPALSSRATRDRGGFSLIEILMTLAVVGLVAGTMIVNFGGATKSERLRAASRKLAGMSDFIRSQAVGAKITCYFDIDFDKSRYRWRVEPPRDRFGRHINPETKLLMTLGEVEQWRDEYPWENLPRDVYFERLMHNNQFFYDKGWQWVQYRPDGTVSSYVLWIVSKDDDYEEAFSIVVNGLTGKSEVLKGRHTLREATEADFTEVIGNGPTAAGPTGEGR